MCDFGSIFFVCKVVFCFGKKIIPAGVALEFNAGGEICRELGLVIGEKKSSACKYIKRL